MKGDFSRITFDIEKHYAGIRTQQGRVQLDADWNEQMDILEHLQRVAILDFIGGSGAPAESSLSGFKIIEAPNSAENGFLISKGRYYINGLMYEQGSENLYFKDQYPDPESQLPSQMGLYLAYLDIWQEPITAIEDPSMLDPALNGLDTVVRLKNIACVRLLKLEQDNFTTFAEAFDTNEVNKSFWQTLTSASKGRLTARKINDTALLQNQLYRIEIHQGHTFNPLTGQWTAPKKITFKWSRNNAAVATRVKTMSLENDVLTIDLVPQNGLTYLSKLETIYMELTEWIEHANKATTSPAHQVLRHSPAKSKPLAPLLAVSEVDDLQIKVDIKKLTQEEKSIIKSLVKNFKSPNTSSPFTSFIVARFWESNEQELKENCYIDIENGLQIQFNSDASDKKTPIYENGDYWLIPARSNTNNIIWPEDKVLPPQGVTHYYAPLSLAFRQENGEWSIKEGYDGRKLFSPLANIITDLPKINPLKDIIQNIDNKIQGINNNINELKKSYYNLNEKYKKELDRRESIINKKINSKVDLLNSRLHSLQAAMLPHIIYIENKETAENLDANLSDNPIYSCNPNGSTYQQWKLFYVNDINSDQDYFYIKNIETKQVLSSSDKVFVDKSKNNTVVRKETPDSKNDKQLWTFTYIPSEDGYYITNKHTLKLLDGGKKNKDQEGQHEVYGHKGDGKGRYTSGYQVWKLKLAN